jgi:hypothetical protein
MGLGEITEIVNASELTLELSSGNYILLTNLSLHIGRTEDRIATTDGGALFTYGKGDNWFTATLLVSTPELSSLNTLTQIDGDGDMTPTSWLIKAKDVSGDTKTFAATGILREYDINKPSEGKVTIDIFVRITGDTISITG